MIESGAQIPDSMTIPCYDRKAVNFLEEVHNSFKSDVDLKSDMVIFGLIQEV